MTLNPESMETVIAPACPPGWSGVMAKVMVVVEFGGRLISKV